MKYTYHLLVVFVCFFVFNYAKAYNIRQISSRDGLSNSSVYCLYQDNDRFLWIGTFDGLNMYDGRNINVYKPDIKNRYSLSSNVIRNIVETPNNYLWISTKWGLNKLSKKENIVIEYHNQYKEDSHICKDNNGRLLVLGKTGTLSLYDEKLKSFIEFSINPKIVCENVQGVYVDTNNMIWINYDGILERYSIVEESGVKVGVIRHQDFLHSPIIFTTYNKDKLLFVDNTGDLYAIHPQGTSFITNIKSLLDENGEISSIIYDDNDLLIGFKTNGAIRLQSQNNFQPVKIDINCGVFSLWKDEAQNVVWIGTDGQGIYAFSKDEYSFNNITLSQLPIKKQRPVRAIYSDHQNNLWLGTKDNGIVCVKNYMNNNEFQSHVVLHYTTNEGLSNNRVFAFSYSPKYDVLWIGSDGPGLNYYSYQDNKIHKLQNNALDEIQTVHALFHQRDSILWVGSGNKLLRISVDKQGNSIKGKNEKCISFDLENNQPHNNIYALHQENDSIIWVGIRGNGLIRLNSITEKYKFFSHKKDEIAPMNDVLCIHQDNNLILWLGTSYGLTRFTMQPNGDYEYKNYNENNGLPNNTIHGILSAANGKLWLSSNTGIILFDPVTESFRNFNNKSGLKNIEFSDNAYFRDNRTSICYFGGVNGVTSISYERIAQPQFTPKIFFTKIHLFNNSYMVGDFEKYENGNRYIELKNSQNFFAVSFVAVDFVNGENSRYYYRLKNFNEEWMETNINEARFTNIAHGTYTLEVRYNDGTGMGDQISSIGVIILPPWYLTFYAKIVYTLLFVAIMYSVYYYVKLKTEKRKRKISRQIEQQYKEEMYERKLRFFTNITHELSTPLTLIHGPCERILTHGNTDSFVKRYAQIIKSNTERLHSLIQEIIDFRRIETGNESCRIEPMDVSKLTQSIVDSFEELTEENDIRLDINIPSGIIWHTDSSCFSKIVNNLVSNAFKYTSPEGVIQVSISVEDKMLIFKVYNTGKGIEKEDIPLIFNRYTVLDNVKENNIKGLSSRNGLGMAICHNLVQLLQGEIRVESEVNRYAEFIVMLPFLDIENKASTARDKLLEDNLPMFQKKIKNNTAHRNSEKDTIKRSILIIDDNQDLLWILKDIFSEDYLIYTAENAMEGLNILKGISPDLIITDIMMPKVDGLTLTKQIKENKHTMHIPLVILSAKNSKDEKIEGIESGADVYIAKPFDVEYLKTVVKQQIKNKHNLEKYYSTSASAYEYNQGQLLEKSDKEFLLKAINAVNDNLENPDFGAENLASSLQMSVRNLYRKFKDLSQPTPNDFIKEQRIIYAARLIITTSLTIQEIIYKSGFNNRSHFYREFSKVYSKTPKEYREVNKKKEEKL